MSNELFDAIGKGITDTARAAIAPSSDHTVPRTARYFGYPLLLLMAWRTSRILFRTVPQDIFGYVFAAFGLFATEIGSMYWFNLMTKHANEPVNIETEGGKKETDNDQKIISAVMFAGDLLLSVVTTVADITDTTGITQVTSTGWAMPVAVIGAGVWAIVNMVAWLAYGAASPVARAERKRKARAFALTIKKQENADEIESLAESVRLREEQIAAKERLLGRVESVEQRANEIGERLNKWSKDGLTHTPVSPVPTFSKNSEVETVPTASGDGHEHRPKA